ncbi:MAG: sodium-dependent transporter [Mucinivorans sp.]
MKNETRGTFKSNFGVMMAVSGSAVGLGNIWRFPYLLGDNGGGAFLILYLLLVLLVGLPLVIGEFTIGRATHRGVVGSFRRLAPGKPWVGIGYLSIITGFTILGFYSVIAGWTGRFVVEAALNNFAGHSSAEISTSFDDFVQSGWQSILYAMGFITLAAWIVGRGVESGIEKFNKILMPALIVILVLLALNSIRLDGFGAGMEFLFKPDFSKITSKTVLDALGQVFFTLSIGMGVMITYSSYVTGEDNLPRSKAIVTLIDTSIAVVAGIAIFPAVFTFGIAPSEGPSLVFLTLPNVFAQIPGGYLVAILFFVMLLIAAMTSAISIMEMMAAYLIEEFSISRKRAITYIALGVFVLATLSALSQIDGLNINILGLNVFDFLDTLSSNYLLTLGGFFTALFVGWAFDKRLLRDTFTSHGRYGKAFYAPFLFTIRFVVPVAVSMIFLSKIGMI